MRIWIVGVGAWSMMGWVVQEASSARLDPVAWRAAQSLRQEATRTVLDMLEAFRQGSSSGYVGRMTEDFRFTSNDSIFLARFPNGWSRHDEKDFVEHLFRGGGQSCGRPLPTVTRMDVIGEPTTAKPSQLGDGTVRVLVEHLHFHAALSDGSCLDFGDTHNTMDVLLTESGWRVRGWVERVESEAPTESVDLPDPEPRDTLREAAPIRLALVARPRRDRNAILFDVTLPRPGGVLGMYDVMGRRVARRNLTDLEPGRHVVTLDAGPYATGVYWARLRQKDAAVTTKILWMK